jgi:hypothetical protein
MGKHCSYRALLKPGGGWLPELSDTRGNREKFSVAFKSKEYNKYTQENEYISDKLWRIQTLCFKRNY